MSTFCLPAKGPENVFEAGGRHGGSLPGAEAPSSPESTQEVGKGPYRRRKTNARPARARTGNAIPSRGKVRR